MKSATKTLLLTLAPAMPIQKLSKKQINSFHTSKKGTRKPNKEYATMKETVCHSPVIDMFLIWQKMTRLPN